MVVIVVLQENLQQWLIDEKARDQFVIRAGTFTEVFWNDPRQMGPELVYQRQVSKTMPTYPINLSCRMVEI